jgi:hypothetical protein
MPPRNTPGSLLNPNPNWPLWVKSTAPVDPKAPQISVANPAEPYSPALLGLMQLGSAELGSSGVVTGGPTTITLGQVVETDTAQSFTHRKIKALGQSLETDTSQLVRAQKKSYPSDSRPKQTLHRHLVA